MPGGRPTRPLPSLRFRRIRALILLVVVIAVPWLGVRAVTTAPSEAAPVRAVAELDPVTAPAPTSATASARLSETSARRNATVAGRMVVSVTDLGTGVTAAYGSLDQQFATASIVKVDILATLLLQKHGKLSAGQQSLARRMIQQSSNGAATSLWRQIGAAKGLAQANRQFGLTSTVGGTRGRWGTTTTTAADQQRLLHDVFTADSPLDTRSRSYLKNLMGGVAADQDWGVSAADTRPGATYYVKNGWLPRSKGWIVNSIGAVEHDGHQLLIVALSDGRVSKKTGVKLVEGASIDAARAVCRA